MTELFEKISDSLLKVDSEDYTIFWISEIVNKNGDLKWKIDHRKYIGYLRTQGYRRYDINKDHIFVLIKNGIIEEISITQCQDDIIKYINSIEGKCLTESGITREELLSKFYTSPGIYFNDKKLSLLGVEPALELNSDTKKSCFIYYSNGFVECTANGIELHPYKELKANIFRNQIKNRVFQKHSSEGTFKQFVFNISGKNEQRFKALQSNIGYLLHGYYETKMKAVNFTDSTLSDVA